MICENCKQRPATVTITMTKNNEEVVKHYCEVCSGQQDYLHIDEEVKPVTIEQIFSDWFGIPTWSSNAPQSKQPSQEKQQCEICGMTYQQFLKEGKFNCPNCYHAFYERLPEVFKRLHNGATEHTGKIPGGLNKTYQIKKEIEVLRQKMKSAVEQEEFEEAAKLRDEVKQLEKQLTQGGAANDEN